MCAEHLPLPRFRLGTSPEASPFHFRSALIVLDLWLHIVDGVAGLWLTSIVLFSNVHPIRGSLGAPQEGLTFENRTMDMFVVGVCFSVCRFRL